MSTRYHRDGTGAYECHARKDQQATPTCRSVSARAVDEIVTQRLLAALNPDEVALAFAAAADEVTDAIFAAYAQGAISRGRFLSSLQNDLHRYYRTICVDYRFKVESAGKHWAIRYFKLRHARKLWHLANLALFCHAAQLPDEHRDLHLATELPRPPLLRLAAVLRAQGGLPLCAAVVRAYDGYLAALADPEIRRGLDRVDYATRTQDPLFQRLVAGADRFDLAAQAVAAHLWVHCNEHLVRYGLL